MSSSGKQRWRIPAIQSLKLPSIPTPTLQRMRKSITSLRPNYFSLHLLYMCCLVFSCSIAIYLLEYPSLTYDDALLIAGGGASGAGFPPVDFAQFRLPTFFAIGITMELGSCVLLTLPPVLIRRFLIRRSLPKLRRQQLLEYKALKLIAILVVTYYIVVQLIPFLILVSWAYNDPATVELLSSLNQTSIGWASFLTSSAFAGVGFSTVAANMVPWNQDAVPLLCVGFLTLVGNTAFPLFMRAAVMLVHAASRGDQKKVPRYLLDHPRRCFTHLFLGKQTLWLLIVLLAFNILQLSAMAGLAWSSSSLSSLTPGQKFANSLFTAICTRTSGFNSIDVASLPAAVLILFCGMMYISTTPVILTMRTTDLSVYTTDQEIADKKTIQQENKEIEKLKRRRRRREHSGFLDAISELSSRSRKSGKGTLRKKPTVPSPSTSTLNPLPAVSEALAMEECDITGDSPLLPHITFDNIRSQASTLLFQYSVIHFIVFVAISIAEEERFGRDPGFTLFSVIFEISSAFGGVGLSMGRPGSSFAFSGAWSPFSKVLLVLVMFTGRQRGLPNSIDRAVQITDNLPEISQDAPLEAPAAFEKSTPEPSDDRLKEVDASPHEEEDTSAHEDERGQGQDGKL